eukprot:1165136-Lingulodinium_polyedra.AAC.1
MDQVCRDNRWELAALMGQLPEPDSEAMARAADRGALVNHSRLAEPRWAAAAAAYLRDGAALQETFRRSKGKGKGKDKADGSGPNSGA